MTDDAQLPVGEHPEPLPTPSTPVGRRGIRWGVLALVVAWTVLLVLGTWALPRLLTVASSVSYNYYGAVRNHGSAVRMLLLVLGPLFYIAPVIVGASARTWRGALAFTLVPVWLALLPSFGASFAGEVPGALIFGAGPVHLAPVTSSLWLSSSAALTFLSASAVFGLLGTIGWLARAAWTGELRRP